LIFVCGGGNNRRGTTALQNLLLMNLFTFPHHGVFSSNTKQYIDCEASNHWSAGMFFAVNQKGLTANGKGIFGLQDST
jgi:hypothetical protein